MNLQRRGGKARVEKGEKCGDNKHRERRERTKGWRREKCENDREENEKDT